MAKNVTADRAAEIDALMNSVANVASQMRQENDAQVADRKADMERRTQLGAKIEEETRTIQGFDAPKFRGLTMVARQFGSMFNNVSSAQAREVAEKVADTYMNVYTGATDKTKKGGTGAGYVQVITLGANAETARLALKNRIEVWLEAYDAAKAMDNGEPKEAALAEARRYTVVTGDTPEPNGDWPKDKSGTPKKPKHNGRPARTVNGVKIEAMRGTNRNSQFAAFAKLFHTYGDKVLDDKVIDSFLDNGGKYVAPDVTDARALAADAIKAIEALNLAGGSTSADAAILAAVLATLSNITESGLKSNAAATVEDSDSTPDSTPDSNVATLGMPTPGGRKRKRAGGTL